MKKRIFSFILALVLALGLLPTVTFAASVSFAGGSGTEADPYLISTKAQLYEVRNYLSAHFKMTCDIEFTEADYEYKGGLPTYPNGFYNQGEFFLPIGTSSAQFEGVFDGNGHVIKNLKMNYDGKKEKVMGLFGYNSGTIKNLGIVDGYIEVYANAAICLGAIAGINTGTVSNCYNASTLRGTSVGYKSNSTMGGIVGNNKGTIEKCYNTGDLVMIAGFYQGGIAGTVEGGKVTNCYNKGEVYTAASLDNSVYLGGIAGYLKDGQISDCYNVGEIGYERKIVLGGIVGLSNGTVTRCYDKGYLHNWGEINAITCGAIIGNSKSNAVMLDCYYANWMGGPGSSPDGATRIEWNKEGEKSSYPNFDFEKVWMFDKSVQKTPMLRAFHTHTYDGICDDECNSCKEIRTDCHSYSNRCDPECNICGNTRTTSHEYENACDTMCKKCGATRTITHSYGEYIYNGDATESADGTKTRVCSICEHKETIIAEGTKIKITDTSKIFTDIKAKAWYKQYVDYSVANGIFTGTSKTEFSPSMNISRAQFVQVLANLSGVDTSNRNVTTEFIDVPAKKWFTPAVKWASENGIVNGMGGGKFEPNANVTREQMCVMLTNYAKFEGITLKSVEAKESFADDGKISKWAKTAVYICQQADIVNGKGAGKFDPKGTGTRAEASVMFTKFHKDYMA